MPASLYEHELIRKCCDGDRAAYRELYDLFSGELLAIAIRYMKTKQEAEDVLQEAYIKVFKNLASFDQRSSLKTWLTRIIINTALNSLRKEHQKYGWDLAEVPGMEDHLLALDGYQFNELLAFIQQLPPGCKAIFNLYALEGYTHKEIALMMKISEGTSKSQYHRAKVLLQEIILTEEKRTKVKML